MGTHGYLKVRNKFDDEGRTMKRWASSHASPQDLGVDLAVQLIRYAKNLPALDFGKLCSPWVDDPLHEITLFTDESISYIYTVVFGRGEMEIVIEYVAQDYWTDGPNTTVVDHRVTSTFIEPHAFLSWATQWEN